MSLQSNGGTTSAHPELPGEIILDFVDNEDKLDVRVEGPSYPGPPLEHFDAEKSYFLPTTGTKGLALILNIVDFAGDNPRAGSERDLEYISKLLTQLDYKLFPARKEQREKTVKTKKEIQDFIQEFRTTCNQDKPESIIVFVGSHGMHPNQIITSDKKTLDLYQDVVDKFNNKNCPGLKGKPKIFLIQTCQNFPQRTETDSNIPSLVKPNLEDVLICTAVMPGQVAQRDRHKGSWFPYCFTYMAMKHALSWKSLQEIIELVKLMLRNIKAEYGGLEQVPTVINHNFKELYFSGIEGLKSRIQKYCKLPNGFVNKTAPHSWNIICTANSQISCSKLYDNLDNCLFKEWEELKLLLSSSSDSRRLRNESVVIVLKNCNLKTLRELKEVEALHNIKNLVLVTDELEQEVKDLVGKVPTWKHKFVTCTDNFEWTDLSLAHQGEIRKRLKKEFDVEIDEGFCDGLLVDLILGNELKLFRNTLPDPLDYYVDRTLLTRDIVSNKIFEQNSPDIFVFSGMERHQLSSSAQRKMTGTSTEYLHGHNKANFLLLESPSHLNRIYEASSNVPVHLIHYDNKKLKWVKTKGDLGMIQKCEDKESQLEYPEQFFCSILPSDSNLPICISDSPGMGKSVLLAQIGRRLSQRFPDRLVFYLELREMMEQFRRLKLENELVDSSAIEKILRNALCANSIGEAVLLKTLNPGEGVTIELLLDALDEVDPTDAELVHTILEEIKKSCTSVRLWVTTRPNLLEKLERTLNVLGYNILPFLENNQIEFLTSFWLKGMKLNEEKVKEFAQQCLAYLKSQMDGLDEDIAGIPLQCLFIAEVFKEEALDYAQYGSSSPRPIEVSTVKQLFTKMIENRFGKYKSIFQMSASRDSGKCKGRLITKLLDILSGMKFGKYFSSLVKGKENLSEEKLMCMHAHVAISEIFPAYLDALNGLLEPINTEEVLKVGILTFSRTTQSPRFMHRTFAEYFVAWFIKHNLTKDKVWRDELAHFFFSAVLARRTEVAINIGDVEHSTDVHFSFYNSVIGYFVNSLVDASLIQAIPSQVTKSLISTADNPNSVEVLVQIACACIFSNCVNLFRLFQQTKVLDQVPNPGLIFNEGYLQLAFEQSGMQLIDIMISKLEEQSEFSLALQKKSLQWAVKRGDFTILEFLLKEKMPRTILEGTSEEIMRLIFICICNSESYTTAVLKEKQQVIRLLTGINPKLVDVKGPTPEIAETPLLFGLRDKFSCHVWLLADFVRLGADALIRDKDNDTILHMSQHRKHLSSDNFHFFMETIAEEKLKELAGAKNSKGETPLMTFVTFKEPLPKTLKRFMQIDSDFNCVCNEGHSVLGTAIKNGRSLETIQTLIEYGSDQAWKGANGEAILHLAASYGNLEAVKYFIGHNGMDANITDSEGLTPLNYVINSDFCRGNRYDTGLALHELGGHFNEGETNWLHISANDGNLESVKLLLQLGMNVNALDTQGNTPLHLSTAKCADKPSECFQIAKTLIEKGANPNASNRIGETPLHTAVKNDQLDNKTFPLLWSKTDTKAMSSSCATLALPFVILEAISLANDDECVFEGFIYPFKNVNGKMSAQFYPKVNLKKSGPPTRHISPGGDVHLLVEHSGANVKWKTELNQTLLHLAAIGGDKVVGVTIIKYLIGHGAEISAKDVNDQTFLHAFISSYPQPEPPTFHDMVKFLVTGSGNYVKLLEAPDSAFGRTPLHLAMSYVEPQEETLELLHAKVDFNSLDKDGNSLLAFAVMGGQSLQLISKLIELGADPKFVNSETKCNMLHIAVEAENLNALRYFLQRGELDMNAVGGGGCTPLDLAIRNERGIEIFALLTAIGASEGARSGNDEVTMNTRARNMNMRRSRHFSGQSGSGLTNEKCKLS